MLIGNTRDFVLDLYFKILQEAACELVTLAANDAATIKLCFEVISELQAAGMELEALSNAVQILKDRFKEDNRGLVSMKVAISYAAMIALDNARVEVGMLVVTVARLMQELTSWTGIGFRLSPTMI
jgi:hypothetical protein